MQNSTNDTIVAISDRHAGFQAPIVVNEISNNCLYSGFFGRLDSARVKSITDKLLYRIEQSDADHVIIDLASIDVIDSMVANHLIAIVDTMQLVGVRTIFCGIKSSVAQTMVATGVSTARLKAVKNLKRAVTLVAQLQETSA